MSDTQFDQDLRSVLRDMAPADVPASLRAAVAAVPRQNPVPAGAGRSASSRPRLAAVAALAAVVVVALVGLAVILSGGFRGQIAGSPSPSGVVGPTGWVTMSFRVLPINGRAPTDAEVAADAHTLGNRLGVLYGTTDLTADLGSDTIVSHAPVPANDLPWLEPVLTAPGVVAFMPMGQEEPSVGSTVDTAANPPLFGNEAVAGAVLTTDQTGNPAVEMRFTSAAAATFATWTKAHVGSYLAVVVDGVVATAPIIRSAVDGGTVVVSVVTTDTTPATVQREATTLAAQLQGVMPHPIEVSGTSPASAPGPSSEPQPSASVATVPASVPPDATWPDAPAAGPPTSVNGNWTSLAVSVLPGSSIEAPLVTAWSGGYLARGISGTPSHAWSSADGRTWVPWPAGFLGAGTDGGAQILGFAPCRDGATALLGTGDGLMVAQTLDGRTWHTTRVVTSVQPGDSFGWIAGGPGGAVIAPLKGDTVYGTTDCGQWSPEQLPTPADTSFTGLAATGNSFVLVGAAPSSTPGVASDAVAWISGDAVAWAPAPVVNSTGRSFAGPPAVSAGGLVAELATVGDTTGAMTLYSSADGSSWIPMTLDGSDFTIQNPDGTWSAALTFTSDGQRILAYGPPGGDTNKPVGYWVSSDAKVWQSLSLTGSDAATVTAPESVGQYPPALLRDGVLFVNPSGPSLVGLASTNAAPGDTSPQPSPSATPTAQPSAGPNLTVEPLAGGPTAVASLARWLKGYLAVSMSPETSAPSMFASADGRKWSPWPAGRLGIGTGKAAFVYVAPCHDGVLVLVTDGSGATTSSFSRDGRSFNTVAMPASQGGEGGIRSLTGGGPGAATTTDDGRVLVTADCATWRAVTLPGSGPQQARVVAAAGSRLVAVGYTGDPAAGDTTRAVAWYSDDGTAWHAVEASAGDGTGFTSASGGGAAVVAALTNPGVTPGTKQWWASLDGVSWHALDTPLGIYNDGAGAGSSAATVTGNATGLAAWGTVGSAQPGPASYYVTVTGSVWRQIVPSGSGATAIARSAGGYEPFLLGDAILFAGTTDAYLGTGNLAALLAP